MEIENFPNPKPARDFVIQHISEEFTSVCPITGHPDYAHIILTYIADEVCLELKSYKIYLQSYRNKGIFYEAVTNQLLDDLVAACNPRYMKIETRWSGRGGIRSTLHAVHRKPGFDTPVEIPPL